VNRTAPTDHPVHDLIARRWSPVGWDDRSVAPADLASLFEAARWAPSAFNEQPWRYLVARREDEEAFATLLSCLVEANQQWARQASALVITVARLTYTANGKPNGTARHDVGLASANITMEATSRGLVVHQMGGILPDRARELYGIPEGYAAITALAIGYAADPAGLPEPLQERDTTPRPRRTQDEFVFGGAWGEAARLA
jgi:nitroreductase